MNLNHIVDLESLAGVEILFKDLYQYISREMKWSQSLILSSSTIHPKIKEEISSLGKIYFPKKVGFFPVPKVPYLRSANYRRILKKENTDIVVIWNRLRMVGEEKPLQVKHIYYEHSTCWHKHDQDKAIEVFSKSSLIIAVSNATKRFLELKYNDYIKCPIRVLPNPVPLSRLKNVERKKSDTIRLGFAAHFIPRKSPWVVIHVLEKMIKSGYKAEAYLAGEGELFNETIELAKKLKVFDYCHFLGSIKDMPEFYANVDYLLAPSISETFGLSPLEAAFQGAIPIVTAVDGLVEVYEEFQELITVPPVLSNSECQRYGGYLPTDIELVYEPVMDRLSPPKAPSPEDVFKKIVNLESYPEKKEMIIKGLRDKIQTKFSFSNYVKGFIEIVSEVKR